MTRKSLTSHAQSTLVNNFYNGTPLCTGSYTLEAAVVIPLIAGFWLFLLFFFRVLMVQTCVYSALSYSSRRTAAIASELESPAASLGTAELFFRENIGRQDVVDRYVEGGLWGISLLTSECSGEYIDLKACYRVKFPIGFFQIKGITIFQESKSKKWTGQPVEPDEQLTYVYVTEYGEAYHMSKDCNYLDLSIRAVEAAQIAGLRNQNEHKYYPCELCAAEISNAEKVYITSYGESYHSSISCGGLKRTIYLIRLSEVGTRHPCKKCAAGRIEAAPDEDR